MSYKDIIGQARALQANTKLTQLDFDIDDMLNNESLHIDARGLPGMFFDYKILWFSIKKSKMTRSIFSANAWGWLQRVCRISVGSVRVRALQQATVLETAKWIFGK